MPDGDYNVTITADASGVGTAMEEAASATQASMEEINAAFEASGAVINDYATQATGASQASIEAWEAYAAEVSAASEGAASALATSTDEIIAELNGQAEAARAAAAAVEESAAQEAAAMQEAAAESEAAAEAQAASFKEGAAQATFLGRALLPLIGISLGSAAFRTAAEGMMQFGDALRLTSGELNVSASQAYAFNAAMSSLGVSAGQVTAAIRRLEGDAQRGGKELSRLGVSTKDASGAAKSGSELFTEVTEKIANLSDSSQKAQAAQDLLGRSGLQLLGVMGQIGPTIQQYASQLGISNAAAKQAEAGALALHAALTGLQNAWRVGMIDAAPAVVGAIKTVTAALIQLIGYCQAAAIAIQSVFTAAAQLGAVGAGVGKVMGAMSGAGGGPEGLSTSVDQMGQISSAMNDLSSKAQSYANSWKDVHAQIGATITEANAQAQDQTASLFGRQDSITRGLVGGLEAAIKSPEVAAAAQGLGGAFGPEPKKGKKGRGGGGADPMDAVDDQLISAQNEMKKLNDEFNKMGSESQIVAKSGTESFQQLKQAATTAYTEMKTDYDKWAAAVKAGDVEAAKAFEKDWKDATKAFQTDFDQAKAKAQQDMQQIKSMSDQISSEISSVLNNAISGKLNWQQEFEKILEKMLDMLIKYCTQMVVRWAVAEEQKVAATQAGAAQGLAVQKAANTQAGFSDAVTAAKGAYSSAAQIPYIGWIIAPAAAAAAFAGVAAFGSAASGAVIPPGTSPLMQLHPNEMVLPASISRPMMEMLAGGGHGGGGNTANINMHMQSLDPRSMADIMHANSTMITNVVARGLRGGLNPYVG